MDKNPTIEDQIKIVERFIFMRKALNVAIKLNQQSLEKEKELLWKAFNIAIRYW